MRMPDSACAVVIGGWVAGYSIIAELHAEGVGPIILLDDVKKFGAYSNKLESFHLVERDAAALAAALHQLHERYERIVVFPTKDLQLEHLLAHWDELAPFCFLPLNPVNLLDNLDKRVQYAACDRLSVPRPESRFLTQVSDADSLAELPFPILLKPHKRDDLEIPTLLRSLTLAEPADVARQRDYIERHTDQGVVFIASEIVPGDGSNIYAYTAFRSPEGDILGEWTGRKLSQHPNDFGVFASASNQAPEAVLEQGRRLVDGLDLHGIGEPEFKFDHRDGRYKLMEVNLRSMMWHHVGYLSGVALHGAMFQYATGQAVERQAQQRSEHIHYIFLNNEINNLVSRKGYAATFRHVFRGGDRRVLAGWDRRDPKPFLVSLRVLALELAKKLAKRCLRPFRTESAS